ncbi:hypothetical protein J8J42_00590 [Chryseobacterium sp. cx-311]|uniref:hypothetical protein n=1 Tax=Marnyiella aurantia TaxID=2758037 RepID=UPI001AEAF573|nr:hypothetical protein [Marnyiella aurantia]MBP0611542.1 hypothetical protein [Marnyiella aurantia]
MGKNKLTIFSLTVYCLLISVSCNRKNQDFVGKDAAFNELLDLKHYQYTAVKLTDSVTAYKGSNNNFSIRGLKKNNLKFGWWEVIDVHDQRKGKFEIMTIDNKEQVNQYIYFDKKGDTIKTHSLFYLTKNENNTITYKVHFPPTDDQVIHAQFYFMINKQQKPQIVSLDKSEVFTYQYKVPVQSRINIVKGMFTIATKRGDAMGVKNLYTLDTITQRN